MKTKSSAHRKLLARLFAICVVSCTMLAGAMARGQSPTAMCRVLNELDLPSFDAHDRSLFRSSRPSHLDDEPYQTHFVLAPNTNPYPFVLDASSSLPADDMTFEWDYFVGNDSDGDFILLGGPSATPFYTNQAPFLNSSAATELIVTVRNTSGFDALWFGVVVLTPQRATDAMAEWLDDHFDRRHGRVQRRLLPLLREASARFANGETEAGKEALRVFERRLKVTQPIGHSHARYFRALSQKIIDTAAD